MKSANKICGVYVGVGINNGAFSGGVYSCSVHSCGTLTYKYVNARAGKASRNPVPRCHPECFFRSETQEKMYRRRQWVTTNTRHGYTGHEHLDKYALINMTVPNKRAQSQACLSYAEREVQRGAASTNGRVYDPVTGRFLSPDPYIQNPYCAQNFDRYSYCWNNPLRYVDPSGYMTKPHYNWAKAASDAISADRTAYQKRFDWIYGRGDYAIYGQRIGSLVLEWLSGASSGGGIIFSQSNSGMIISSNSDLNGSMISRRRGVSGVWIQINWCSGQTSFSHDQEGSMVGQTVSLNVVCIFIASSNLETINNAGFTNSNWWNAGTGAVNITNAASNTAWKTTTTSVKLGSADVSGQKFLRGVTKTTKYLGWAGNAITIIDNVNNVVQNWGTDMQGYSNAQAIGDGIIIGVNALNLFLPGAGTVLSIGLGAMDANGAFDGVYEWLGEYL